MSSTAPAPSAASVVPVMARFNSKVELTIHSAVLSTAGVLQADPLAVVELMTVKKLFPYGAVGLVPEVASANANTNSSGGGVRVTLSSRELGRTQQRLFTSRPHFNETLTFEIGDASSVTSLSSAAPAALVNTSSVNTLSALGTSANLSASQGGGGSGGKKAGAPGAGAATNAVKLDAERETIEEVIVITLRDRTGTQFFGQATCPFSPHCNSESGSEGARLLLQPRNAQDPQDPLYLADMRLLRESKTDDFGFVQVSWKCCVIPEGGGLTEGGGAANSNNNNIGSGSPYGELQFPLGLTLKATWLATAQTYQRGATYSTSVEFGGGNRFVFQPSEDASSNSRNVYSLTHGHNMTRPLFLTIKSASQLEQVVFHCCLHNVARPELAREVSVPLPIPTLTSHSSADAAAAPDASAAAAGNNNNNNNNNSRVLASLDRDLHWAAPARTPQGEDLGILLASIRLSRRPFARGLPLCPDDDRCPRLNDPLHQEEFAHSARPLREWQDGRPRPDTVPLSAYQPLCWEGEEHVSAAAERAERAAVLREAQPTPEHARHILEVLMGRAALDASVARVAASFANRAASELTALDLKSLMIGCCFAAKGVSAPAAARFAFIALRSDREDSIAVEEVHYLFQHSLLPGTIEMSTQEMRRWVNDIFGNSTSVSFADFTRYVLRNYALWAALGVPLTVDSANSSGQRHHHVLFGTNAGANTIDSLLLLASTGAGAGAAAAGMPGGGGGETREASAALTAAANKFTSLLQNNSSFGSSAAAGGGGGGGYSKMVAAAAAAVSSAHSNTSSDVTGFGTGASNINLGGGPANLLLGSHNVLGGNPSAATTSGSLAAADAGAQGLAGTAAAGGGGVGGTNTWRSFIVRLHSSKKAFSVTAHASDSIEEVMLMIERSAGVPAARQEWYVECAKTGKMALLDRHTTIAAAGIGSTAAAAAAATASGTANAAGGGGSNGNGTDVWIREKADEVSLTFCFYKKASSGSSGGGGHRQLAKKWHDKVNTSEKVIALRAAAQRQTLIPLSRCVLKAKLTAAPAAAEGAGGGAPGGNNGKAVVLLDRHTVGYYGLQSGDIVEVTQE